MNRKYSYPNLPGDFQIDPSKIRKYHGIEDWPENAPDVDSVPERDQNSWAPSHSPSKPTGEKPAGDNQPPKKD